MLIIQTIIKMSRKVQYIHLSNENSKVAACFKNFFVKLPQQLSFQSHQEENQGQCRNGQSCPRKNRSATTGKPYCAELKRETKSSRKPSGIKTPVLKKSYMLSWYVLSQIHKWHQKPFFTHIKFLKWTSGHRRDLCWFTITFPHCCILQCSCNFSISTQLLGN